MAAQLGYVGRIETADLAATEENRRAMTELRVWHHFERRR
jgi:hypothetical protein